VSTEGKREKDFNVTCVSWAFVGSLESLDDRRRRFWVFVSFLQRNGLTTRMVAESFEAVSEASCLKRSDLTNEGLLIAKTGYQKWLRALDRRKTKTVEDVAILERSLSKLRGVDGKVH
jgi:hypothetical protein